MSMDLANTLPSTWVWATLKDVCLSVRQITPKKLFEDEFNYIEVSGLNRERHTVDKVSATPVSSAPSRAKQLVFHGDVLFSNVRVYLENIALVPSGYTSLVASSAFSVLRPSSGIESRFLFYYVLTKKFIQTLIPLQHGNSPPAVLEEDLRSQRIPLPPANEQSRIVSKIEELFSDLDKGEESLRQAQARLRQYRQAVLKAAVTGELTRHWREQRKGQLESGDALLTRILATRREAWEKAELEKLRAKGKPPKDEAWRKRYCVELTPQNDTLGFVPASWIKVRVDTAGEVQLGRQRAPKHHYGPNMRPYLRVANVFEERIDISDVMEMNFSDDEFVDCKMIQGDVLLNEGQSADLVGRPAIYRDEMPGSCFTNTLVRFRAYSQVVIPEYALIVFLYYMHSERFKKIAKITTNIAHLGAGRFAELSFPLPLIEEQYQIVEKVGKVRQSIDVCSATLKEQMVKAIALRQSILKSAFSGTLVPQDPNDEPVSALLERIAAEKADQKPAGRSGRPGRPRMIKSVVLTTNPEPQG